VADQNVSDIAGHVPARTRVDLAELTRWVFARLFTTSTFLLAARLFGAAAGFVVQLVLARMLPADALGTYFTASSLIVVAGMAAAHGYPSIAMRFVSRYQERRRPLLLAAFARHAQRAAILLSLLIVAGVATVAAAWPGMGTEMRVALLIAAATIPFGAAFRVYGSFAGAIRAFKLAYLPDTSLKPVVMLAALAAVMLFTGGISLTAAMLSLAGATVVLALAQFLLVAARFPVEIRLWRRVAAPQAEPLRRLAAKWRGEANAVLLVAVVAMFFPDISILIATPVLAPAAMGAFGICVKLAFLVGFFVVVTQYIATPDIADALNRNDGPNGARRISQSCIGATAVTLVATLTSAFFGHYMLRLFGPDFATAENALTVLVASQVVRAVFGPNNAVLTIAGERKVNLLVTAFALVVLVLCTAVLGNLFGLIGAAWAVFIATLAWSGASGYALYRTTGLRVDLFGQSQRL